MKQSTIDFQNSYQDKSNDNISIVENKIEHYEKKLTEITTKIDNTLSDFDHNSEKVQSGLQQEYETCKQEFNVSKEILDGFIKKSVNHGLMGLYEKNANNANIAQWFWNITSIVVLITMVCIIWLKLPSNIVDLNGYIAHTLSFSPIIIGCASISYICSKNARIAHKIAAENMHKWSIMSAYIAYHEDYEEADTDFRTIMLDAVHRNPSDQIHKLLSWTHPLKEITSWLKITKDTKINSVNQSNPNNT
jgi:hypothetical protein